MSSQNEAAKTLRHWFQAEGTRALLDTALAHERQQGRAEAVEQTRKALEQLAGKGEWLYSEHALLVLDEVIASDGANVKLRGTDEV